MADDATALFLGNPNFNVSGSCFSDIQAVGYYYQAPLDSGVAMDLTDFEADFVVIPEPASSALLGLGGVAMFAGGKRRA